MKKTHEKNERGPFSSDGSHTCNCSGWKSRGVGSSRGSSQLSCQEGSGKGHRQETKETIKRVAVPNHSLSHGRSQEENKETTAKRRSPVSSKKTTNRGQDRRRDEYVLVRPSSLVRRYRGETGFPSCQGDQRQRATLSTSTTERTRPLGHPGKCRQDRLQTRQGQEV